MDFISLGSGSSGNCYFLIENEHILLIDLGLGIRTFKKRCDEYGLSMGKVKGVLVTHNHVDHTKGVAKFSNEFHVPVYTTEAVHQGMHNHIYLPQKIVLSNRKIIKHGERFEIGPFKITAFGVPHDSMGNNGYFIEIDDIKFCLITDMGHCTDAVKEYVSQATHLVVEANYDPEMLEKGPYPLVLKRRIKGPYGHHSNPETADLLTQHLNPCLIKHIWLCHLSEENNSPDVALNTIREALINADFDIDGELKLEALPRTMPSKRFCLE